MNVSEPYCFETDREEDWYSVGLVHGLQIADEEPNSQWISMNDSLPCYHKELICKENKNETKNVIAYCSSTNEVVFNMMLIKNGKWKWLFDCNKFDYWLPIPELPK